LNNEEIRMRKGKNTGNNPVASLFIR